MPTFIVKIKDRYMEWSTIVDAPMTDGMTLPDFISYYEMEYGRRVSETLNERLERVEKFGTSTMDGKSFEDLVENNRAGDDDTCLTIEEIWEQYCEEGKS